MTEKAGLVHVEIFGQSYAVRAGSDSRFVEELAAHVDAQMREVSKTSGAVDSVRIAVLAALNIADERFRIQDEERDRRNHLSVRAEELERMLDSALELAQTPSSAVR